MSTRWLLLSRLAMFAAFAVLFGTVLAGGKL
jgi:hypothetical protein